jgi:hypothetical protein
VTARPGDRVQAHPATDSWMMGDRWGSVAKVGPKRVHVNMERSGRLRRFAPENLLDSEGNEI